MSDPMNGFTVREFILACQMMQAAATDSTVRTDYEQRVSAFVRGQLEAQFALICNPNPDGVMGVLTAPFSYLEVTPMILMCMACNVRQHLPLLLRNCSVLNSRNALDVAIRLEWIEFMREIIACNRPQNKFADPLLFHLIRYPAALIGFDVDYCAVDRNGRGVGEFLVDKRTAPRDQDGELLPIDRELVFAIQHGAGQKYAHSLLIINPWYQCLIQDNPKHTNAVVIFFLATGLDAERATAFLLPDKTNLRDLSRRLYLDALTDEEKRVVRACIDLIISRSGVAICAGLQSLQLPALLLCEILEAYFWMWPCIAFHHYWRVATAVKHFRERQRALANE